MSVVRVRYPLSGLKRFAILALSSLVFLLLCLALLPNEATAALGAWDDAKIKWMIYPTLGNPAIVKSGGYFDLELDPRRGVYYQNPLPVLEEVSVNVVSSCDKYPYSGKLPVESFEAGYSKRWPELKPETSIDKRIYLIRVRVPYYVPRDLYDVSVKATLKGGKTLSDSQPHSLMVVESFKKRFSFVQLSDIHVFGPEASYPGSNQKERSGRPRYEGDPDPNRKGAIYYRKAINQINIMKPDFCIFTGDYIFGQKYFTKDQGEPWGTTTEYEYEMLWFYEETLKLEVPVFMVLGNHDGYYESSYGAGEDWQENWKRMFGPLYYTFDYGDARFFVLNSLDWAMTDRSLFDWLGIILQPRKYKGQLRGGGDPWESGISEERFAQIDEKKFTGQLAWLRDELKASKDKAIRICAMHHDPFKDNGSGSMWEDDALGMGGGQGRLAVMKLMRDYNVALEISGHDHSDYVGSMKWSDGKGNVLFVNTTSTSFQSDGNSDVYPGYRRIWINGDKVESFNYLDPKFSYPFYKGTNVGGTTNLGSLVTPAIETSWSPGAPGNYKDVTCTVVNNLSKSLPGAYLEYPMPHLSNGYYYKVSNGRLGDIYDVTVSGVKKRVYQVYADVDEVGTKSVRLSVSSSPDKKAPTASILINDGAKTTTSRSVNLSLKARDGESGLMGMMISNYPDFRGAKWERFQTRKEWKLASGESGRRTVYARFADCAMPSNVTEVKATIIYVSTSGNEGPSSNWYFAEGCTRDGFEEWLTIQNPFEDVCDVDITFMLENGENIPLSLTLDGTSRYTLNVNQVVGPERDVSLVLESSLPVYAERPLYFNYQKMWRGGDVVVGARKPLTRWYFAEGCTREIPGSANFHTWFCVLNPQPNQAKVKLTYMLSTGETRETNCVIAPKSRKTICANWEIGPGHDFSTVVEASLPVVCERPVYFDYGGVIFGGHNVMGIKDSSREWYFAEGTTNYRFDNYLCIQNPSDYEAQVKIEYRLKTGDRKLREISVSPKSRYTHFLNSDLAPGEDFSLAVFSDVPVLAERPVYFIYGPSLDGGHCVTGINMPRTEFFFAEGCTRDNFEEWLCIQNATERKAKVKIDYMLGNSETRTQEIEVNPYSRYTVSVNAFLGGEYDVSVRVRSDRDLVVERPIYFLYGAKWAGGHCAI